MLATPKPQQSGTPDDQAAALHLTGFRNGVDEEGGVTADGQPYIIVDGVAQPYDPDQAQLLQVDPNAPAPGTR